MCAKQESMSDVCVFPLCTVNPSSLFFGHVKDVSSVWHGHVDKRTHCARAEQVANWSGTFRLSGTNSDTMKMSNILLAMVVGMWLSSAGVYQN